MLQTSLETAESRLGQVKQTTEVKQKLGRINACEESIREAQAMRRSYMMELQLLTKPADRDPYRALLEGYDKRIANVDSQLKWEKTSSEKTALTGGKGGGEKGGPILDPEAQAASSADALLKETQDLQGKTTSVLEKTRRRAQETKEIGKEIADTLQGQTEQINRIDEGVANLDSEVARANQILGSIIRRMATDKVVMCFLFVFIALIITVIVYTTVSKRSSG